MRQIHRAGEKLFIGYGGSTIGLSDGSCAYILVAAMRLELHLSHATPRHATRDHGRPTGSNQRRVR